MWARCSSGTATTPDRTRPSSSAVCSTESRRCSKNGALRAQHEQDLAVTEAEITEAAIDRYLLAFEPGTLPAAQCGERVRSLVTKLDDLRRQRDDVTEALEAASTSPPTAEQLADVRTEIQAAIETGTTPIKKALLQALVQEITVEGPTRHPAPVPGTGAPRTRRWGCKGSRAVAIGAVGTSRARPPRDITSPLTALNAL